MKELIVDSFAGGGGASLGIKWATGREPDIAINHDSAAIQMHAANHPGTTHYTEDVWKVDPRKVTGGRPVGLLWASPDCKHFSRAKGAKPVEKKIRSLAWVVIKWAAEVKPRMIFLENVREFEDWGPLVPRWACGECDWKGTEGQAKLLRRRRACPRCDAYALKQTLEMVPDPDRKGLTFRRWKNRLKGLGYQIETRVMNAADFGTPTHRKRLFLIARRDGLAITWPDPTHADPKKITGELFSRNLQPWKTAAECIDWTLPVPSIFTRKKPLAEKTMERIAHGIKRYVLDNPRPFIVTINHGRDINRSHPLSDPLRAITGSRGQALVSPTLIQIGYGERDGQRPRTLDLLKPMGTVVSGSSKQGLVTAFLAKHYGGVVGQPADRPLGTVTSKDHHSLVAANIVHLKKGPNPATGADEPLRTILSSGTHAALVYSFLIKYFGTGCGQVIDDPLHTVTTKDRFGLITVMVEGEPYAIVDIGMRMLTPRELARGQGFPDDYILTGNATSQVARIGNSVCPTMAEAIVAANFATKASRRAA